MADWGSWGATGSGTPAPAPAPASGDSWGTPAPGPAPSSGDSWSTPAPGPAPAPAPAASDSWGATSAPAPASGDSWGTPAPGPAPAPASGPAPAPAPSAADSWGASAPGPAPAPAPAASDSWGATSAPAPAASGDSWGTSAPGPAPAPAPAPASTSSGGGWDATGAGEAKTSSTGTDSWSASASTPAPAPGPAPAPAPTTIPGDLSVRDILTRWETRLKGHRKEFRHHAKIVFDWGLDLHKCREKLLHLSEEVAELKTNQGRLDAHLDSIESYQTDMRTRLEDLERKLDTMMARDGKQMNPNDMKREQAYNAAKRVENKLDSVGDSLNDLIDSFNRGYKTRADDEVQELRKILQAHMAAMSGIKGDTDELEAEAAEVASYLGVGY